MDPCRFLEWDTAFFGCRLASVNAARLDADSWAQVERWCAAQQIDGLYFLADAADSVTNNLAQQVGFGFYGIRLGMERQLNDLPQRQPSSAFQFREAIADDVAALEQIAHRSYTGSRFYNDPHFADSYADRLYEVWIRRSVLKGFADAVLVAVQDEQPVAFVTVRLDTEGGTANIPLVGVAAAQRGQGIGQALMAHTLHWLAQRQQRNASIVMDGSNIAAQRLYQTCGFRSHKVELWYHKWFTDEADS